MSFLLQREPRVENVLRLKPNTEILVHLDVGLVEGVLAMAHAIFMLDALTIKPCWSAKTDIHQSRESPSARFGHVRDLQDGATSKFRTRAPRAFSPRHVPKSRGHRYAFQAPSLNESHIEGWACRQRCDTKGWSPRRASRALPEHRAW